MDFVREDRFEMNILYEDEYCDFHMAYRAIPRKNLPYTYVLHSLLLDFQKFMKFSFKFSLRNLLYGCGIDNFLWSRKFYKTS